MVDGFEQLTRDELLDVVREQLTVVRGQAGLIAELREQVGLIAELREANGVLAERVRRLERLVSRNSGNSSMPPSSDDVPGRKKPAPRRSKSKSGRSRGKQPGADGAALAWVQDPDATVPHRPDGRCGCGAEHVGALPAEVSSAPASYGPNIKALVVYLIVFQHVPIERYVQLIADLTGGEAPSTGFAHGMLARCAAVLADVAATIKTMITAAVVAGFDETTLRCGPAGQKKYVLSASTEQAVAYHLGGRGLGSFRAFGILPGGLGGVRWSVYEDQS